MSRNSKQIFEDLVNLNADEWNLLLSEETGIPVKQLKDLSVVKFTEVDQRLKVDIDKDEIIKLSKTKTKKTKPPVNVLDKYVVTLSKTEEIVASFTCTGKIIVGIDFSSSTVEDSYFCHCIFYNCDFSGCNLGGSIFSSCSFNKCDFKKTDFTGSSISRSKYINCNLVNSIFDYTVLTDNAIMSSNLSGSSFIQAKILYSGFNECNCSKIDWKDVDFVQVSFSTVDGSNSDFRRAKIIDSVLINVNLKDCDFNLFTTTSITCTGCQYDKKHKTFFKDDDAYNPSIFEWKQEELQK